MRPYGPRVGPTRDSGRPRSPGASPAVDVRVHRHILEPRSGRGRPRLSSMGPDPIAIRTVGRFHRRMRRSPGRERVRVDHGRPAASRSARDRCRVPFVDVHGTGPSRGGHFYAERTGVHTEKAPTQPDWWYRRVAAVLRKVYLKGPVGTARLAAEFGGRRDDGSAPYHPRRGSRSIAREAMQQLESLGLLSKTDKRGRSISAAGRKLLDSLSHEILMELAKTTPELAKYAGGR